VHVLHTNITLTVVFSCSSQVYSCWDTADRGHLWGDEKGWSGHDF